MTDLNQAVYAALSAALAAVDHCHGASVPVRRAIANPSPPPPPTDQDILYYHLVPEEIPPLTEQSRTGKGYSTLFHFTAWQLMLVFYGPRACSLAWLLTDRIFADGPGNPRWLLRKQGIYPVPRPQPPVLIWEEWGKEHRPRADLTIRLRAADTCIDQRTAEGNVDIPPEIQVHLSPQSPSPATSPHT